MTGLKMSNKNACLIINTMALCIKSQARRIGVLLMISFLISSLMVAPVSALTKEDRKRIFTPFYDENSEEAVSCGSSVSLAGNENAEKVFNFFVSKGYKPWQAAGIVGNMTAESGVLPQRLQGTGPDVITPAESVGSRNIGWGLVQWTPASKMIDPTIASGKDPNDLGVQVTFLWEQLEGGGPIPEKNAGDELKSTTNVEDAVLAFQGNRAVGGQYYGYERPADQSGSVPERTAAAKDALARFGSGPSSGPGAPASPSSSGGCGSGGGGGQINGDPYTDSSNIPCAAGTTEVRKDDGYVNGNKFPVTLCSLPNLPSTGSADNGFAIVNSRVSGAWFSLVNDAKAAGINLSAGSSFRTMASQASLWNGNPNPAEVAQPGFSSHQAGVAIDFTPEMSSPIAGQDCAGGRARLPGNKAWEWMYNNAEKYGFKQYSAEAWHWDALVASNRCGAGS